MWMFFNALEAAHSIHLVICWFCLFCSYYSLRFQHISSKYLETSRRLHVERLYIIYLKESIRCWSDVTSCEHSLEVRDMKFDHLSSFGSCAARLIGDSKHILPGTFLYHPGPNRIWSRHSTTCIPHCTNSCKLRALRSVIPSSQPSSSFGQD